MKIEKTIILPGVLKDKIDELEISKIQRHKAYKLCELILNKQSRDQHDFSEYVELPQEYLRKLFGGGNYHTFLNKLKPTIIQTEGWINESGEFIESYSNVSGDGQSKRYRIRLDLVQPRFTATKYQGKDNRANSGQIWLADEHFSAAIVTNDISKLIINKESLMRATDLHVETINRSCIKTGNQITENSFEVMDTISGYRGYSTLEICQERAKHNLIELIQDDRKFVLANVDKYILKKKENTQFNYLRSIEGLCNVDCHYAKRNNKNSRLDHNLTSLSSKLLEVIKQDNNLVEIDMKNSQFAILAWLMKKDKAFQPTDDYEVFADRAAKGELYEYIKEEYTLRDRLDAKAMMFELAFSGHKNNSADKSRLKVLFPSIVNYCDQYKRKHGDNELAVWLQQEEAKLFVDNFYSNLKTQKLWVLTRHDSLLVNQVDAEFVKDFVDERCKALSLLCSLSIK